MIKYVLVGLVAVILIIIFLGGFNANKFGGFFTPSISAGQWTTTSTGIYYNSGSVSIGNTSPIASLQIATTSSTISIGTGGVNSGCIELYDKVSSSTIEYVYSSSGSLVETSTKPVFCQ